MAREQRKTVTVLFCDLAGSTALGESVDPERLRALLAAYFERMKAIVEHHGGTVEKFIGDAVMAVFGVPSVHEDDALRAVRAAVEMRDALPELGLEGRIGVMTGEVVTGTEERLATGDPVNVAARLEQAAGPGEILIGELTLALVRDAVETAPVEPLVLRGKRHPVPGYRLLRVLDQPERRHEAPFVGRESELERLREAWRRARSERCCELVTVAGEAGVGKSRLVAEALASMDARVARGRCLPYGEGITYWPVVEVVKQLGEAPPDEAAAAALRSLLGESDAVTSAEEIAWAFRKLLEHHAAPTPLVVVFDDIQWGEEAFLDLIEHVALLSSGAPLLLLCMARPDLGERRPAWPISLRLDALGDDDVETLIGDRVSRDLRERISRAASGNPLFVEEMLTMVAWSDGDVVVPPTLRVLLAARLDQIDPAERSVLERGSIEGEVFHRGAVQALGPDEDQVTPRLAALVRKGLVKPERSLLPGDDGFRFRHLLLRDAAYDALPKAARADMHRRFAVWLEQRGSGLVELEELLAYHLEQAWRFGAELARPDDELAALARRRLTSAGRRARARADEIAAVNLLERATALVPTAEIDLPLELELVAALFWAGRTADAVDLADDVARRAAAAENRVAELCAMVKAGTYRLSTEGATAAELEELLAEAVPMFEAAEDDFALFTAYQAVGQVANVRGLLDAAGDAYERAAAHAQRAGLPDRLLAWRSAFLQFGTATVGELLAWLDENEPQDARNHWLRGRRALALAMLGRFDESRAILDETLAELTERGQQMTAASILADRAVVERWAGDPAAAVTYGRDALRLFEELEDAAAAATAAAELAEPLYEIGSLDEAEEMTRRAAESGPADDAFVQMRWRQVRAKLLARRGDHEEAERLAREAVAIGERTDLLDDLADAYSALAESLLLAGRDAEAGEALGEALARFERKGNLVSARRVREQLAALGTTMS